MPKPSWMKGASETADGHEDSLQFHLHAQMHGRDAGRSFKNIHASAVTRDGYCPREGALTIFLKIPPKDSFRATVDDLVWTQGNFVADHILKAFAKRGILVADWRCPECGALHELLHEMPEGCSTCHVSGPMKFEETRFRSMNSGISGGIDALVQLPGRSKLMIVELKTAAKDAFKGLSGPLKEHRERTQLYLKCAAESAHAFSDLVDLDEARILYVTKDGWGEKFSIPHSWGFTDKNWTPFKEYVVKRNDGAVQHFVDLAQPLWQFMKDGTMPAGVCPSAISNRAQRCPVRDACFSGKYKAGKVCESSE